MTPSFAVEATSPSQQEVEIARRLELLESRFLVPHHTQQQNHGSDSTNSPNNPNAGVATNNDKHSVMPSNAILPFHGDGSQHSFSFEGYSSLQKENVAIVGGVTGDLTKVNNKNTHQPQQQSEAYRLLEKAAHLHIQKLIDDNNNNNNMLGRSHGSSSIVLESPTTSFPDTEEHGHLSYSSAGQGEPGTLTTSAAPHTTSTTSPTTEGPRNTATTTTNTTEDSRPPLVTVNMSGRGTRKSVPMKRTIVSVTDGTAKPTTTEGIPSSTTSTTLITSNNESNGRGGVRKRTRLHYPQLAIQSASTTVITPTNVTDASTVTPTNTTNKKQRDIDAVNSRHEKVSPERKLPSSPIAARESSSSSSSSSSSTSSKSDPPPTAVTNKAAGTTTSKKSGPPPNNTTIRDFFKSSTKVHRSPPRLGTTPPKHNTSSNRTSQPTDVSPYGTNQASITDTHTAYGSNTSQDTVRQMTLQMDELRMRCEALEQSVKEKDEQLEIVHSSRSILHTTLKTALEKKEQELQQLRRTMEERVAALARVLDQYILKDKALELKAMRQTLASNSTRLGRFVYTRTLHGTMESWESGEAMMALKRQREELKLKRDVLEQRQKDAKKVCKRVIKEQQQQSITSMDNMPPPAPVLSLLSPSNGEPIVVGGLLVQDELDAMEAEESVRMHLTTIKQQEIKLSEEEKTLNAETAVHIRSLKRLANEDSSRFQKVPKLNDRYTLLRLLGKGGFSEVWEAFDSEKLREVAVKIHQIDPRWSEAKRENYTKHVSREYQIHRDVRHPRIVSLYDVFEIDSNSFATVLECCKGTDLDALLKEKRTLPERDARAILLQILDGMRYLSSPSPDGSRQGIIHYDLKPGNILFDEFGDAKITDFGLSKIVDAADSAESMELTSQGAGTYWYLPPECFITNQSVRISNKVDVWSIGVIYYQMLFGARPFGDGMSQEKVLCNHTMLNAREVKFPAKPTVSQDCIEFIRLCLTYDQAFRPTIAELCSNKYLFQKKL